MIWSILIGFTIFTAFFALLFLLFIPQATAVCFHLFFRLFYRIRFEGKENLPKGIPFVLASNHVSFLDGQLMYFMFPLWKKPRIIFWHTFGKPWFLHKLAVAYRGISLAPGRESVRAIREASKALDEGDVVGIFVEGGITRHGTLMPFKPGLEHMLRGKEQVPVVPVYIGGLWGSIFSHKYGKFIWKWPERFCWEQILTFHFRRNVTVYFGEPIVDFCHQDIRALPDAVQRLQRRFFTERLSRAGSASDNFNRRQIPVRQMIRKLKKLNPKELLASDLSMQISRRNTLLAMLVFRRRLRKVLGKNEQNIGVLIPPCVPSLLANGALGLDRRTAVNLNYTLSNEIMNYCVRKVGISHIVTSRRVMKDKNFTKFKPECDLIFLEDVKASVTLWDKLCAATQTFLTPLWLLERQLGLHKINPDDPMTIIFTSGSTGIPKGVVLSHKNIGGNIDAFCASLQLTHQDSALGILPFFHSFGYSCILWSVLSIGLKGYYHTSPLDCQSIAKLCRQYAPTILVGTPTFLRMYAKRINREDLASVDIVVSGGERCPAELMDEYEERFGVRPVQGAGVTEASPVIAVNMSKSRMVTDWAPKQKDASIGLPLYGTSVQIRNLDTGEHCRANEVGMLWISGINVMSGYYGEPEKTAEVLKDGWYCTGDLVSQDESNFLFISGRLSRFAKIGGEMVPHEGLEDALNRILGNSGESETKICVTSIPDEKKGEKLIVLHTELSMTPKELNAALIEQKYPSIWIPNVDAYFQVESIPLLGTGKLDLCAIRETALKLANS